MDELVKRWRYRTNWHGKLILQVGEMRPYNFNPEYDTKPGGYSIQWRDATVTDLTIDIKEGLK